MFERFSGPAREGVVRAQEEARALAAAQVLPAHLLLGAVAAAETSGSPAAAVLAGCGLTAEALRAQLRATGQGRQLGEEDAAALKSIGIDLQAVRRAVEAGFGPGSLDSADPAAKRGLFGSRKGGHIPFSSEAKTVMELSLRESLARKDGYIGVEHILLAVLRRADPAAMALVGRHAVPKKLAAQIRSALDAAA
jgi:ATP-dependent Clp protease ATP-binding subunit ClpA